MLYYAISMEIIPFHRPFKYHFLFWKFKHTVTSA
jgi:hypothetical protein